MGRNQGPTRRWTVGSGTRRAESRRRGAVATGVVLVGATALLAVAALPAPAALEELDQTGREPWIWISPEQVRNLPMSGPEWDARGAPWNQNRGVYYYAQQDTSAPLIGNQDDSTDVYVMAKAMVWLRLKQEATPPEDPEPYRAAVQAACLAARGTEYEGLNQTTLALGRNLLGYVVAANLIDWDDSVAGQRESDFRAWVNQARREFFADGVTFSRNLTEAHETRANNWGLMCGASRLAAALYLHDDREEQRCWDIFRRWLGDTSSPFEFPAEAWGGLSWQADRAHPVGINPINARKRDCGDVRRVIGGVLPDEMRRAGPFDTLDPCDPLWTWPAFPDRAERNYNWNALQAVLAQAVIHDRRGRNPWRVGTWAIARAFDWLYTRLDFPVTHPDAGDDDYWMPAMVNHVYPLNLPEPVGTKPGQQVGYTDWTTLDPSWP